MSVAGFYRFDNCELANLIRLKYFENAFQAGDFIIKKFQEIYPHYDINIIIVDEITFNGTEVTEVQHLGSHNLERNNYGKY